jgi:serine/threonine protein phosphatase PrpC
VRTHNEDSYLVDDKLGLYVVADGMGGHAGGAHASKSCVEVVSSVVARGLPGVIGLPKDQTHAALIELLAAAASEASARIFDRAQVDQSLHGMGTTLCGVLFHGDRGYIVHVGDSRIYLLRGGAAEQLTVDHSWLNEQVQAGLMTPEEAAESDLKHIITRSVGFEREVQADVITVNVLPGDAFLLCSDGLCNYLETDEIGELGRDTFYCELPKVCVDLALDRGGDDNVTVVVVSAQNATDMRQVPGSGMAAGAGSDGRRTVADTLPPV